MKPDPPTTIEEMILDYYKKDRRYTKSILFLALVGVGFVIAIFFTQLQRTKAIQDQVQCIATFFTQTDRQNLKIPTVDDCRIIKVN